MRLDLFPGTKPPRAKRRVMMHGVDHGYDGDITLAHMVCGKCGHDADWLMFDNDSEARRGAPCPKCNADSPQEASDA